MFWYLGVLVSSHPHCITDFITIHLLILTAAHIQNPETVRQTYTWMEEAVGAAAGRCREKMSEWEYWLSSHRNHTSLLPTAKWRTQRFIILRLFVLFLLLKTNDFIWGFLERPIQLLRVQLCILTLSCATASLMRSKWKLEIEKLLSSETCWRNYQQHHML